jgi:hypothetical protein
VAYHYPQEEEEDVGDHYYQEEEVGSCSSYLRHHVAPGPPIEIR